MRALLVIAIAIAIPVAANAQQSGSSPGSQFQQKSKDDRSSSRANRRSDQSSPRRGGQAGSMAGQGKGPLLLTTWDYAPLYTDGWSARALYRDTTVLGPYGDDIGSVENLILSDNGKVVGVIAEIGGFLDIGDTHLFVPWDEVKVSADFSRITVPVTEATADNYNFFDSVIWRDELKQMQAVDSSTLTTGPSIWKLSEVLGDWAYLSDRTGYGYVYDLVISRAGDVQALVVRPGRGYAPGYRAVPWRGYRPYGVGPYYDLGYRRQDLKRLEPLELGRIAGGANSTSSDATGSGAGSGESNN